MRCLSVRVGILLTALCLGVAPIPTMMGSAEAQTDALDVLEIINRVQDLYRGDSSHGVATMEVVTEHWSREVTIEIWSLGEDHSLVRIQAPAKEAGTATLMADEDIWNYLPKVDRTIKVPASMMGGSWMGSHFTNDDLVQESRLAEDYDIELTFDGERDGVGVWDLALTPKPEAAVVWGRVEYTVRQSDFNPLRVSYYDEDGELSRSMEWSEFKDFGGRVMPALMDMRPADKPDERTTLRYDELQFGVDIGESFFSLRTLQSRR